MCQEQIKYKLANYIHGSKLYSILEPNIWKNPQKYEEIDRILKQILCAYVPLINCQLYFM